MIYKRKLISFIINNTNILQALGIDISTESEEDIVYKYIFPYLKNPNTQLISKSFITMEVDSEIMSSNKIYKDFIVTICVICHDEEMKFKDEVMKIGGTRLDYISGEIVNMFNWENIGFTLELQKDSGSILNDSYFIRELVFKTISANSMSNGVKINGIR